MVLKELVSKSDFWTVWVFRGPGLVFYRIGFQFGFPVGLDFFKELVSVFYRIWVVFFSGIRLKTVFKRKKLIDIGLFFGFSRIGLVSFSKRYWIFGLSDSILDSKKIDAINQLLKQK